MSKRLFLLLILTTLSAHSTISLSALTQDPVLHWRTLNTKHFEIHFHDNEAKIAREVGDIAERVHTKLSQKYHWSPKNRTQVILSDRFDYSNGSATPFPRNEMRLIVTPPNGASVIGDYDNWLELLITHEYTHIVHLDKADGLPYGLRNLLGRFLFLFPNILQPAWFIEGLATYEETDGTIGVGRGQNTYFRMLMRLEVENGIKPLRQVNQPLVSWPMNTTRYLYGVYFFQFIVERYGPDKVTELVEQYSDNLLPFAINSNAKRVLGKELTPLWTEFSEYLKNKFSPEIDNIRQNSETSGDRLTQAGYFTGESRLSPNGDVYFLQNDMESEPRLKVIKNGEIQPKTVADVHGSYFDFHPQAGILTAELDLVANTNVFSDLYHIDPANGVKTQLTRGARYLYASWNPDGTKIIAVQNQGGEYALHLLDNTGKQIATLWQGDDNSVLGPPSWSPDGSQIVISRWRANTHWNIETFSINNRYWKKITYDRNIQNTPRFTADGQSIIFSADYGGVFNIHKLNINTGQTTTLTNVVGGAFSPNLDPAGRGLFYMGANANGFDLYHLSSPLNTVVTDTIPLPTSLAKISVQQPTAKTSLSASDTEDYNAFKRITPTTWFPYLWINNNRTEVGFSTWGADPLKRHSYNLLLAYDTENKWWVGNLSYLYDRWDPSIKLSFDRQALAYLFIDNSIERFTNLDTFTAEALWPLFSYEQQWLLHAGVVRESESDKDIRSILGPLPTVHDDITGIAVSYNSAKKYARSISPSNGRQFRAVIEDNNILDSYHSGQTYTLDWREFFDLPGQHVFKARAVLGWGTDNPNRFQLGGTQEHSVSGDPQIAARAPTRKIFGQRQYPLHGYPQGRSDLRGRRMALAEAEWRFPITLVERGFMVPPVGLHQVHGKLFYNWGETWEINNMNSKLRSGAGAEISTELILGYWLPVEARLGYAKGFDEGGEEQSYLELYASF